MILQALYILQISFIHSDIHIKSKLLVNHCLLFMQFSIHSPNIFCIDVRMENLHILNIVIISNVLEDNKWMEESFKNFRIFWNRKPIYPIIKGIQVVFQMKKFELISLEYVLLPHLQIYLICNKLSLTKNKNDKCKKSILLLY